MFAQFDRYRAYAPTILRLTIGLLFLLHGLSKFGLLGGGGLSGTAEMFGMMGMPAPSVTGTLVALIETAGGLALIVGFGTRIVALLLAGIMIVAILAVKLPMAPNPIAAAGPMPGYELDLSLLAGLIALVLLGPGALAMDERTSGAMPHNTQPA